MHSSSSENAIQQIAISQTLKHLRTLSVFAGLPRKTLKRWITHSYDVPNRRGPYVDKEFDAAVWHKLLLLVLILDPITGTTDVCIKANVAF
jgi:hypothetical protein